MLSCGVFDFIELRIVTDYLLVLSSRQVSLMAGAREFGSLGHNGLRTGSVGRFGPARDHRDASVPREKFRKF